MIQEDSKYNESLSTNKDNVESPNTAVTDFQLVPKASSSLNTQSHLLFNSLVSALPQLHITSFMDNHSKMLVTQVRKKKHIQFCSYLFFLILCFFFLVMTQEVKGESGPNPIINVSTESTNELRKSKLVKKINRNVKKKNRVKDKGGKEEKVDSTPIVDVSTESKNEVSKTKLAKKFSRNVKKKNIIKGKKDNGDIRKATTFSVRSVDTMNLACGHQYRIGSSIKTCHACTRVWDREEPFRPKSENILKVFTDPIRTKPLLSNNLWV